MPMRFKILALAAVLAAGTSGTAMAQACPPGYRFYNGACRAVPAPTYPSGPVRGAVTGETRGAARGAAAAGPVGAIVGGAIGTATGTIAGTANAVGRAVSPPARACAFGYHFYRGVCYPNR